MDKYKILKKANHYQEKANELYEQIEAIEQKERLIGFKTKNDNRICGDRHEINVTALTLNAGFGDN